MYPLLKSQGCIGCEGLKNCAYAVSVVREKIECSLEEAKKILEQMIPDARIEDYLETSASGDEDVYSRDTIMGAVLSSLSTETVLSDEEVLSTVLKKSLQEEVASALSKLTPKEERVLRLRYGFDGRERTLEEVGTEFHVTRERIRQIEAKALRRLRHPSKSKVLKEYY